MLTMEQEVRRGVVLAAVQRAIFCAETGKCLDIDDAVLVTSTKGGACILTGAAWRELSPKMASFAGDIEVWTGKGAELELRDGKTWCDSDEPINDPERDAHG